MPKLEVNPYQYDSRMIEWNMKGGRLTPEQLQAFVKALPDDAANCEPLRFEDEEDDIAGDTI